MDLFSGEDAPPHIEKLFTTLDVGAPANLATRVVGEDVHKLIERKLSDGQTVVLWVAPTRTGGWCFYLERVGSPPTGGPGCNAPGRSTAPLLASVQGPGEGARAGSPVLLSGAVREDVSSLTLNYSNGAAEEVPLVKGFFLVELPPGAARPESLTANGPEGKELANVGVPVGAGVYPGG